MSGRDQARLEGPSFPNRSLRTELSTARRQQTPVETTEGQWSDVEMFPQNPAVKIKKKSLIRTTTIPQRGQTLKLIRLGIVLEKQMRCWVSNKCCDFLVQSFCNF